MEPRLPESLGNQKEFYFYIAPSIKYQVYDATIQGSLLIIVRTFDLIPVRFNGEAGLNTENNLNLSTPLCTEVKNCIVI
jgi:hypothetical protein